jgi:hypothetical protein
MAIKQNVHGEGNYEASRQYNDATKKFVSSGRVDAAARDAAPKTAKEATEMKQAEQAALLRSKDKSPAVKDPRVPEPAVDDPQRDSRSPEEIDAGTRRPDSGPDSP